MPESPTSPDGRASGPAGGPQSSASRKERLARLLRERLSAALADHPLSYNQRSLWFLNRLDPDSAAYNVAYAWRVRSRVDDGALRRAFERLVDRHAILRTVYGSSEPRQLVLERQELDWVQVAASGWSAETTLGRLRDEAQLPFDLEQGPVLRVRLFMTDDAPILLVTFHHIAYDLWSMVTLLAELNAFYASEQTGTPATLSPLPHQYVDFVRWQADMLASDGERHWSFWTDLLSGPLPVLTLPQDRPRPALSSGRGAIVSRQLPPGIVAATLDLARAERTTAFSVLLAAYQALLHALSGQPHIIVGSPIAGRTRPEHENLIGYFLNTLPFPADASGDPSFRTFVASVRQTTHGVLQHQDYPLELLVARLRPARSASHAPLFQALFVLNRPHVRREQEHSTGDRLVLDQLPLDLETSQFDISLEIDQVGDGATARWEYSTDLFERQTIEAWTVLFERLLERATATPDLLLSQLLPASTAAAADARTRTAAEETVAAVFCDVLERPAVDVTDSFVALGGTPHQAVQVVNRLARLAGVELPVAVLFELLTIERIAAWLEEALLAQIDDEPTAFPRA